LLIEPPFGIISPIGYITENGRNAETMPDLAEIPESIGNSE
jgi:hypothetical protein